MINLKNRQHETDEQPIKMSQIVAEFAMKHFRDFVYLIVLTGLKVTADYLGSKMHSVPDKTINYKKYSQDKHIYVIKRKYINRRPA